MWAEWLNASPVLEPEDVPLQSRCMKEESNNVNVRKP